MTFRRRLLLITLAAMALRLAYVMLVTQHLDLPDPSLGHGLFRSFDELYYVNSAHSIADGDWFRFQFLGPVLEQGAHPPLTSLMLTPVAAVSDNDLYLRLFTAVGGAATVAAIGCAGRLAAGERVGLVGAGLATVYPNLWMNDGLLLSETWAALAVALTVVTALRAWEHPTPQRCAVVGVAAGLAALGRSELVLLTPILALGVLLRERRIAGRALLPAAFPAVLLGVAALLTVAPWIAYNLSRFEEPVFMSHADGDSLIAANCDSTYYGDLLGFSNGLCGFPAIEGLPPGADASVDAARKREVALEYIGDHLDRLPVVVSARLGRMFSVYAPRQAINIAQAEGRPTWASTLGHASWYAVLVLAVIGIVVQRRSGRALVPLLAPIISAVIQAMVFVGWVRHRVPAEIGFVLLAAIAIAHLLPQRTPLTAASPPAR